MRPSRWLRTACGDRARRLAVAAVLAGATSLVAAGALDLHAAHATVRHAPLHQSEASDLQSVTRQIMCQCGCNLTVSACEGTMTCDIAARMKREALGLLRDGNDVRGVLASFQSDYGEQVLGAPTKEGFNLTAWILPFAALGVGVAVIVFALLRWRHRAAPVLVTQPVVDAAYLARIEEEVAREP